MSLICPLCGNSKLDEEVFCKDCSRKINKEYEVTFDNKSDESSVIVPAPVLPIVDDENLAMRQNSPVIEEEPIAVPPKRKKKNKWQKVLLIIFLSILLIMGGLAFYKFVVIEQNQERALWETVVRENNTTAYLKYMDAYPNGEHFSEAQSRLMQLKGEESSVWSKVSTSNNLTAINDFLKKYPNSPYTNIANELVDSLSWITSMNVNTAQSYADYIDLTNSGKVNGSFSTIAQERYNMLHQRYPVDSGELDTLKKVVEKFYTALSTSNYNDLRSTMANTVLRFFDKGTISSQKLSGDLLMSQTKFQDQTIEFVPDINSLQYEKTPGGIYLVNVPLTKTSIAKDNFRTSKYGYIAHIELNSDKNITSVYESKPSSANF